MATVISPVQYQFECGDLDWRVRTLALEERLNHPFFAELRLVVAGAATMSDLLDRPASLTMTRDDGVRTFHGEVTRVEVYITDAGHTHARIAFEPLLARARRCKRNRIFQGLAVTDVVRDVLTASAPFDLELVLEHDREPRDYCVQYDESDLDFVSRLLEDEGLAWFLDTAPEPPKLHLVETSRGYPAIAVDDPTLRFIPQHFEETEVESIQALAVVRRSASPAVVERDWQWITDPIGAHEEVYPADGSGPTTEVAQPRRWANDTVEKSARVEHERLATRDVIGEGRSNVTALSAGSHFLFDLWGDTAEPLLVIAVMHRADCPEVELSGGQHRGAANYANTFECQPLDVPHRPQRTIPRPRIHSMHTAVVTGPDGEEIYTDEHGRIRVRMHWDRSGSAPELSSCWIRVAQTWAGSGWGTMFIPRVGMEVLVAFMDGDPDRPMCIGCVYNGSHRPPYTLPDDRTKSTIRTQSSPGGGGHNELTFEDAAGSEQIYVRAQRDLSTEVLRNESRSVGADQSTHVGHDRSVSVDGDQSTVITGKQTIDVGGTKGSDGTAMKVNGCATVDVEKEIVVTAKQKITLQVGKSMVVIDGQTIQLLAGAGTLVQLDLGAMLMAAKGSLARLGSGVTINSASGGSLQIEGSSASLLSAVGSIMKLSDEMSLNAAKGASLTLTEGGALVGSEVTAESTSGGMLTLDASAALVGAEVSCTSAGGALELSAGEGKLTGPSLSMTGASAVSVTAPMVKLN